VARGRGQAMTEADRQEQILALVHQRGFVSIEALAEHFSVTPQTVRRDVNRLCAKALLRRYHGGAGLPSSVENTAYQARQVLHLAEKRRIAAAVAAAVPDGASIFINIGTTMEQVARALLKHRGLRIITNNLHVAHILAENEDFEVLVAGGQVSGRERGLVGEATKDFIGQFKTDFGIIGVGGIDGDGTLLDFDFREVRVSQAMMANARRIFVAADHSKFGRAAMARLGSLAEADAFFTDRPPPAAVRALLKRERTALHIVRR
jgi:DeoR family transcriptional regulator, glycerol-3-phosphate regulon repressor